MHFYSTNKREHRVDARTAVLSGLASDGGLYMPERIPLLPPDFFVQLPELDLQETAFRVVREFFRDEVDDDVLKHIVHEALNFEIPLKSVGDVFVLELFHGPTLAFKDVGARFMARLMGHFVQGQDRELTMLVATSGDTGSAVANGFYRVPGIRVVVLYPHGKISRLQEAQMTTLGENVVALEVDGVFDDCQRLVKEAFVDPQLRNDFWLSSANSINIARLIPQAVYYFWAVAQLSQKMFDRTGARRVVFSVPSGNFGDLTAGLIAKRMGLSVGTCIAATNVNDVVPEYLETAIFRPRPSIATMSNAMDVGNPSNFARMRELYPTVEAIREDVVGMRVSEEQTRETIAAVLRDHHYQLDPHGAVAYAALQKYCASLRLPAIAIATAGASAKQSLSGIFFETAHPAKFLDVEIPSSLAECLSKSKQSIPITATLDALRSVLE